jgi:ammonium transporter, Amt family
LAAGPDAGAAVLNTNMCTAVSVLVWTCLDIIFFKKPAVMGAIQGMITGLVAITPAAGESLSRRNCLTHFINMKD